LPDAPALLGRESRQLHLSDNTVSRAMPSFIPPRASGFSKTLAAPTAPTSTARASSTPTQLKLGDQIRVGNTLLVFGAQPGISRAAGRMSRWPVTTRWIRRSCTRSRRSEDSMVLAVPEPTAAAMANLKLLYQLGAALGSSFDVAQVAEVVMDLVFEHVKADRGICCWSIRKRKRACAAGCPHARRSARQENRRHRIPFADDDEEKSRGREDPRLAHDH
jgi:hypothetical protein